MLWLLFGFARRSFKRLITSGWAIAGGGLLALALDAATGAATDVLDAPDAVRDSGAVEGGGAVAAVADFELGARIRR